MQAWLQHWAAPEHDAPSASHVGIGAPQTPALQAALQQSATLVQGWPSGLQVAPAAQLPPLQLWLQQALLALQLAPWAAQVGWAQLPLVQVLLQQSLAFMHGPPDASQADATHFPPVQVLVQQSLPWAHDCPVGLQALPAQIPAVHESLQQSVYWAQVEPDVLHLPGGTGVFEGPVSPPPPPIPSATLRPPESWLSGFGKPSCAPPFDAQPPNRSAVKAPAKTTTHRCDRNKRGARIPQSYLDHGPAPAGLHTPGHSAGEPALRSAP